MENPKHREREIKPARKRRPNEVVVGEPIVENRNKRLPLCVPLFHPLFLLLLHLRFKSL